MSRCPKRGLSVCVTGYGAAMTNTDRVIAANIARIANERGVKIAALARRTGTISGERLRQCLTGRYSLTTGEAEAVAEALGVPLSELTEVAA